MENLIKANFVKANKKQRRRLLAQTVENTPNYNHGSGMTCAVGIARNIVGKGERAGDEEVQKFFGMNQRQMNDLYWARFPRKGNYIAETTASEAAAFIRSM